MIVKVLAWAIGKMGFDYIKNSNKVSLLDFSSFSMYISGRKA